MKSFRFPLEKALELRRMQLELKEAEFQRQAAVLLGLDHTREALLAAGANAEAGVRGGESVGTELMALGAFRLRVQAHQKDLARRRAEEEGKLKARRDEMLEARRRFRLLEKLKERRKAEWDKECNRELEELAAESYFAKWSRGHNEKAGIMKT